MTLGRMEDAGKRRGPVETADAATKIAVAFLSQYYQWFEPLKAKREGSHWLVEVDTGAIKTQVAKVKIEASSGRIVELERPTPA